MNNVWVCQQSQNRSGSRSKVAKTTRTHPRPNFSFLEPNVETKKAETEVEFYSLGFIGEGVRHPRDAPLTIPQLVRVQLVLVRLAGSNDATFVYKLDVLKGWSKFHPICLGEVERRLWWTSCAECPLCLFWTEFSVSSLKQKHGEAPVNWHYGCLS